MRRAWGLGASLACLAALAQPAHAGFTVPANRPGAFAPRDECAALPGATAFRSTLRGVVARRDVGGFVALTQEGVMLDYGGGAGRAELRRRLSGKGGGELWGELDAILKLGCARSEQGELVLPWFFAQDLGDVDPYDALLAAGPDVPLHRRADGRGKPVARLNWQIVANQPDPQLPGSMRRVLVINSKLAGFVPASRMRSPIGYRLFAARKGGEWQISTFIAGD